MPKTEKKTTNPKPRIYLPVKSRRVRRLSDGRVFSCAEAAAYALNNKFIVSGIINCCFGYLREVAGERWEFADDYIDSKPVIRKDKGPRKPSRRRKSTNKSKRYLLMRVGPVIQSYVNQDTERAKEFVSAKELFYRIKSFDPSFALKTPNDLSKHISWWIDIYRAVLGIRFEAKYCRERQNKIRMIAFFVEDSDGFSSFFDEVYEVYEKIEKKTIPNTRVPRHPGRRGHPVHYLNADVTFASIRSASRATGIPYNLIKYCCEGDIPRIEFGKRSYSFEYGDPEKVIYTNDDLEIWSRKPRKRLSVICINTGQEYSSLSEASRSTGISMLRIRRCCEGEVVKFGKNNEIWDYGFNGILDNSGNYLRFQYSEVYYGNVESWRDIR